MLDFRENRGNRVLIERIKSVRNSDIWNRHRFSEIRCHPTVSTSETKFREETALKRIKPGVFVVSRMDVWLIATEASGSHSAPWRRSDTMAFLRHINLQSF
ncbi:hypothetical protein CCR75_003821 [Bremia lactucae]|uniref:Uncharacterized protein n=1 Tax=Bremia lactucae TaxID=4779 RepID=A0A976IDJ4_BRELC|nr:hypothetical protein CCR75_003821 [Bremia lactucae]